MRAFETIGSATLIAYDDRPILTNDAWINDSAFFGSWQRSHEIPPAQMAAIRAARFHWFSHGHPDHLNLASLAELSGGQILLSDHYGSRMANDLAAMGLDVRVLPDHRWISLSPAIRIYSIANQNQDSVLLVDINGRLVINLNDSPDYGAVFRIRRIARAFRPVYCLQLHCWGGTDMANLHDEAGAKLTSPHELSLIHI